MLLLPPAGKLAEVNYWTTPNIQASLEQDKQLFSTNNTATEIYAFFAIWFLFSKSENAEELNSRLCPGFTAVGSLPCCLIAPCPWRQTSIRSIFSLNPLNLSRLWVTSLWSCWWTPCQDLSLLLRSSWGGGLHYSSDNPIHSTWGMTLWSIHQPSLLLQNTLQGWGLNNNPPVCDPWETVCAESAVQTWEADKFK